MPTGQAESVCSSPGQDMSQLHLSWGPLKPALLGHGERGGHGGGELEPSSPAVIYGGAGNEAGWQ